MENRLGVSRQTPDSGSYSDLNRLNQLKVGKDRDSEENVRKVAQEFESLFMNEMLKSMRSATEVMSQDNPFNSQASKQYQDMHDQQLARERAGGCPDRAAGGREQPGALPRVRVRGRGRSLAGRAGL